LTDQLPIVNYKYDFKETDSIYYKESLKTKTGI